MKKIFVLLSLFPLLAFSQEIALLKYRGGGDWYANPTSLPNLVRFCNTNINTRLKSKINIVTPDSSEISNYPYVHLTGHGNVIFNTEEELNLRNHLNSGGFLHIDDNYGMDEFIRNVILKLFPDNKLVEIPSNHAIFQKPFLFANGLPKIHEHDGKRPQAFGIFIKGRLVLLYTFESDLGDGWEDTEIHNDPVEVHEKALKMGANIIQYIFNN